MSAHTPGPWKAQFTKSGTWCVDHASGSYADAVASCFQAPEAEANARLIAAAPQIYEALIAALPYLVAVQETFDERGRDVVLRATAALARVPS